MCVCVCVCYRVTGELREKLSKEAKVYAEKAKKRVRSSRENGMSDLRKKQKTISTDTYNRLTKYVSIVWGRGVGVVKVWVWSLV